VKRLNKPVKQLHFIAKIKISLPHTMCAYVFVFVCAFISIYDCVCIYVGAYV